VNRTAGSENGLFALAFFLHDAVDARGLYLLGPVCQTFVDFSFFVDTDWPVRAIGRVRLGQIDLRNHGVIGTPDEIT